MIKKEKIEQIENGGIVHHITKEMLNSILKGKRKFAEREICCDCTLTHMNIIESDMNGGLYIRTFRDDCFTENLRKTKKRI